MGNYFFSDRTKALLVLCWHWQYFFNDVSIFVHKPSIKTYILSEMQSCEKLEIAFLMNEKNGKVEYMSDRKVAGRLTCQCSAQY